MSKEINQALCNQILKLVHNFHNRTAADYVGLSNGIESMKFLSRTAMILTVIGMGLMVYYEYHIMTLVLGAVFYVFNRLFKNSSFLYIVKNIYEQESALLKSESRDKEDDDLEKGIRQIVRQYLTDSKKNTKELLDKVS